MTPPTTLLMTEEFWANSQFSVARYAGGITFDGHKYIIVDKYGRDLFQTSIFPGDPADLIWDKLQPAYRTLGRDRIMQLLRDGDDFTAISAEYTARVKASKPRPQDDTDQLTLDF